jgi:hypothetical protein
LICRKNKNPFHKCRTAEIAPQIVRAKVEDLLRDKHLRFVCCTSTLLQGVNLPTKNIFVENPKRGPGQPMTAGDFWNLVGRAGRLAKEFQGNIFCINKANWDSDPLVGTRFVPLRSAFEDAAKNNAATLLNVAENPPRSSESDFQWAEQAPIFALIQKLFIRADYDRHKYFTVLAPQWDDGPFAVACRAPVEVRPTL